MLIAPLAVVPVIAIYLTALDLTAPQPLLDVAYLPVFLLFGTGIAYVAVIVLGIPLHLLLARLDRPHALNHGSIGCFLAMIFAILTVRADSLTESVLVAVFYGLCGFSAAAIFAVIANLGTSKADDATHTAT